MKIWIADDHEMVRLGLRTYLSLEPDIEVMGESTNGRELVDWLDSAPLELPDIFLVDLMMPELDGVETAREITVRHPKAKVVILTSFLEDDRVVQAMEVGATAYVLKTVSSGELIASLRNTFNGQSPMQPEVSQALARGLRQRASAKNEDEGLTLREKEVLMLIAEGKTNKEISEELHISIKTVKTHVSNLLMKCELEDRTQLAIYAHRKGWVQHT